MDLPTAGGKKRQRGGTRGFRSNQLEQLLEFHAATAMMESAAGVTGDSLKDAATRGLRRPVRTVTRKTWGVTPTDAGAKKLGRSRDGPCVKPEQNNGAVEIRRDTGDKAQGSKPERPSPGCNTPRLGIPSN